MLQHRKTRAALCLAGAAMPLGGANAQTAAVPPAASTASAAADAGEIIVTAQKRSQSINTVGMAITSLSGMQLKEQGVASVADLAKIDPSFVFSQAQRGQPVYTIRGIGYNDFSLAATPTVTVYTDEVPYALPVMTKGAGFDLDRVEVLKGPQGTLFGQNATGGAVNYIAAKPTDRLMTSLEAGYASYNAVNVNGFVSGPLTPTLNARLAFNVDEGGAWQRSDTRNDKLGSKDDQQARLLLDWTPTSKLKVSLNVNGWIDHSDTLAGQEIGLNLQSPKYAANVPHVVNEPLAPQTSRAADWKAGLDPHNDEHFIQASLHADYAFTNDLHITYVGSYQRYNQHDINDNNGQNIDFYLQLNGFVDAVFQELRLGGRAFDQKLDWVIGGNFARTLVDEDQNETLLDSTTAYSLTLLHQPPFAPFVGIRNVSRDVSRAGAVFGNAEYHLTSTLDVHAGGRFTQTDINHGGCTEDIDGNAAAGFTALETRVKKGIGVVPIQQGGCVTFGPGLTPGYNTGQLNQGNFAWSAGVDWTPIPRTLVYAIVSKGYKAGSFPTLAATSYLQLQPVTQESVLSYETGVKSRVLNGLVELNGAVFHYDYTNKQLEGREPDPSAVFGFLNVLVNVPKSSETGAELNVKLRPVSGLVLSGRATYLDSHVDGSFFNYNPFVNTPINLAGEAFPNTPRWATGFDGQYNWRVSSRLDAYAGVDVRYQSSSQGAFGAQSAIQAGYPSFIIDSYTLVDLRAGLSSSDKRWSLEAYGTNVGNTYYWTQVARPAEAVVRFAGQPAIYGVRLRFTY